jgi:hypothetical protein
MVTTTPLGAGHLASYPHSGNAVLRDLADFARNATDTSADEPFTQPGENFR